MKPILRINEHQFKKNSRVLGMSRLLKGLGSSDLFDVSFHNESINVMRGNMATIIYYNDKKICLDLWEYPTPSHTLGVYNANFDLIIKIQHKNVGNKAYNHYCNRKKIMNITEAKRDEYLKKFVTWTFFPSRMMDERKELIVEDYPVERDCFFCGKAWKCRSKMLKSLEKQHVECIRSSQELLTGRPLTDEEYLHNMQSSKYGLVLRGRSSPLTDCKNRREIDYMMLKKPLLMDYQPLYYNELKAGKHYILIDENTDIKLLDKLYNIEEIANNGYEWYKQNATLEAMSKTFLQIMRDKF